MSKVTNSILLRYGINHFWSSSLNNITSFNFFLQLQSFFPIYLKNYFFNILKIHYTPLSICIYIYYFKEDRYSFLYKFLKLKKIILNKLLLRKYYSLFSYKKDYIKKPNTFLKNLIFLLHKKYNNSILYKTLKYKTIKNKNLSFFNITINNLILKKKKLFFNFLKIKYLNYLIKMKWLGIFCTYLLYLYINKQINIIFKSITQKTLTNKLPFIFKYFQNITSKIKFYLVFLSLAFFKASILTNFINILIKKTKNKKHVNNLSLFFESLKIIFEKQFVAISGLKFKISGRLNGKLRKSSFNYNIGNINLMSFNVNLSYYCDYVYTQYGSFSLKLWLCENID